MTELRIRVPGTPVPMARARITKFGNYNKKEMREYKEIVKQTAAVAMKQQDVFQAPAGIPISVELLVCVRHPTGTKKGIERTIQPFIKRPDLDNYVKLALDALQDVVYPDDGAVWDIRARKLRVPPGEQSLEITVRFDVEND